MSYDTPFGSPTTPGQQNPITSLPLRQQLKVGFKDMGTRSWSMARNFGKVGALFSGIECGIEGMRAKNDLANGVAAAVRALALAVDPERVVIGGGVAAVGEPLREAVAVALAKQAETSPFLASLELASRLRVVSAAPVAAIGAALITPITPTTTPTITPTKD
jgi:hypothetical protein